MGIVVTPTLDWLRRQAAVCEKRLLISSPYVNGGIKEVTSSTRNVVKKTLVTQTDLRDFALNASSLDCLCELARNGIEVKVLGGLHAKVYVFDDRSALVTSANATVSGLRRNWECGLETTEKGLVSGLAKAVLGGFGAPEPPSKISLKDLEALFEPLAAIKAIIPKPPRTQKLSKEILEPEFHIENESKFVGAFSGWTRLTLEGVLSINKTIFSLNDVERACSPKATKRYPTNRHVRAKLRQQLQVLRTRGIIEFLGGGTYQLTMR
ncbi:MAG: hypothetical protein FJ320_08645 [SAR202 cluster bacterium]|nr:hypothetical protein [SAR202 cluster bacterium]